MKCPMCNGECGFYESVVIKNDLYEDCDMCGGDGKVPFLRWLDYKIWENIPAKVAEFICRFRKESER